MAKCSLKFLGKRKAERVGVSETVSTQHMLWDSSAKSTERSSTRDTVLVVTVINHSSTQDLLLCACLQNIQAFLA